MTTTPEQISPGKTPKKSWATRTTLITAAAVAGVIVAGTAAVAANIGILNAADSSTIGELAATDQLVAIAPSTSSAPATSSVVTTVPSNADGTTEYAVDDAGTVKLANGPAGLTLADVSANAGWTPAAAQTDPTSLTVGFTDGTRTVIFTATLAADGSIVADVTEPIVVNGTNPTAAPTAQTPSTSATGRYDDDDHEDHDEREYEGADDDD